MAMIAMAVTVTMTARTARDVKTVNTCWCSVIGTSTSGAPALERFAAEGSEPFYRGDIAQRVCDWVRDRGGTLGTDDMAAYEPVERRPVGGVHQPEVQHRTVVGGGDRTGRGQHLVRWLRWCRRRRRNGRRRTGATGLPSSQAKFQKSCSPSWAIAAIARTGAAIYNSVTDRRSNDDFFTLKLDHNLSPNDTMFVRYLLDDSDFVQPRFFPNYTNQVINRKQVITIEERKIINSYISNEFRFGFNRATPAELVPVPAGGLSLIAGQPLGEINVTGLSPVGTDRTNPKLFYQNNVQLNDNLFVLIGRHNLKMGFTFERFQFNGRAESRTRGRLRFRSVDDLLTFTVRDLEGSDPNSDFVRGYRQSLFGGFFQDDFKLTPRLTLNLGARYEVATSPTEVNGKNANLRNITANLQQLLTLWIALRSSGRGAPGSQQRIAREGLEPGQRADRS